MTTFNLAPINVHETISLSCADTQHYDMQIYTHKTIDITSSAKTGEKTFEHMKEEIELLESRYEIVVIAVISDAAGEAAKARRLLRAWRPDLLTVDCFAHQFNLSIGGEVHLSCVSCSICSASLSLYYCLRHTDTH